MAAQAPDDEAAFLRDLVKASRQKIHHVQWKDRDGTGRQTALTQPEVVRLNKIASRMGVSKSEVLRQAAHVPVEKPARPARPPPSRPPSAQSTKGKGIGAAEEQPHRGLEAPPVGVVESGDPRAVEVEDPEEAPAEDEGNDDLRARGGVAGNVPGKRLDVGNDDRSPCGGPRSRRPRVADRDPHAGHLSLERPEHELAALREDRSPPS